MQALWFLEEQGEAYRRQGKLHLALKRFHQVEKVRCAGCCTTST
jgi:predicted PhzF superfamily epimerase YddE/YHI9